MCQDELKAFGITESQITQQLADERWQAFMQFNCQRVSALMKSGKPLGRILKGRIGFEMRLVIAGGERIIAKINAVNGDVFHRRPTLNAWDWCIVFTKAVFRL